MGLGNRIALAIHGQAWAGLAVFGSCVWLGGWFFCSEHQVEVSW